MKITQITRFAVPAMMAAGLLLALPAVAQQAATKPAVLGVVDTDIVLRDSLAGKALRLESEKYQTLYGNQVKDIETKLKTENDELGLQRNVVAQEVFAQRATQFQQKVTDYQNLARDKQERLEVATNQAAQEIFAKMVAVSQEIAKERGLTAVVGRQMMLAFDPSMDITRSVLDKLNATSPSVAFQNPDTLQRPGDAPPVAAAKPEAPKKK